MIQECWSPRALPRHPDSPQPAEQTRKAPPAPGRILVVDDTLAARELLEDLLTSEGYAVVACENGRDALAEAIARPPDLVLLDVMMPQMSGFEVCERLRANPAVAEVPILIMTALHDRASRLRGLEAGADDVLVCPFDDEILRARVRTVIRLNRYQQLSRNRHQLEILTHRLLQVQEQERRILASELHDEVGGMLTSLIRCLRSVRERYPAARFDADLEEVIRHVHGAERQIREIAMNLRPAMLDHLGLVPTLRWLVKRQNEGGGSHVSLKARLGEARLPGEAEITAYRLVQEALRNATRHARARRVRVWVGRRPDGVVVSVRDDGEGFDVRGALADGKAVGILGIQERLRGCGGRMTLTSHSGRGTRVAAWLPLPLAGEEGGAP